MMDEPVTANSGPALKHLFDRRPRLSDCFSSARPKDQNDEASTSVLPKWESSVSALRFSDQEDLLVDNLLYCMQGIEGDHVRIHSSSQSIQLMINPHFDESIRELAGRIISVCSGYHCVAQYTEWVAGTDCGTVSQAFSAAARTILDEYNMYVAQLESCQLSEGLSLQKMWYHMQPVQHTLKILADACLVIKKEKTRGGALLTFLHSKCEEFAGDTKAREMFTFLLVAAAKPYFYQLERWMYHGELMDNYDEFMIIFNVNDKQRQISGTAFDQIDDWERRYWIRRAMCPSFLLPVSEKILNSGKYLNIISSCGHQVEMPSRAKLQYSAHDRRYLRTIEEAYGEAGRALVSLLIDDFSCLIRLQSLKHYFLLDRGDWLLHFMENAETELRNAVGEIIPHRVANFLALAFNSSSVSQDSLKEQIRFEFLPQSLTHVVLEIVRIKGGLEPIRREKKDPQNASGFDAFAISYDAEWPLSIVFNKAALFKYQIMFRQLLAFKNIERQLSRAWISRRGNSHQAILLHKLVTFARKFLYHASVDVIEPYWHRFMDAITSRRNARETNSTFTLDDLLREHNLFLDSCTADLLLTEEPLILCVDKIVDLCKEAVKNVEQSDEPIDVDFMEQEYATTVEDLLSHMRSLSNTRREKGWLDVAYSLGLVSA